MSAVAAPHPVDMALQEEAGLRVCGPSRWAQSRQASASPAVFWPCGAGTEAAVSSGLRGDLLPSGPPCEGLSGVGERHQGRRWPCVQPRGVLPIELLHGELEEQPLPTSLRKEAPAVDVSLYAELMLRLSTLDEKLDHLTVKVSSCLDTCIIGPSATATEVRCPCPHTPEVRYSSQMMSEMAMSSEARYYSELSQMVKSNRKRRVSIRNVISSKPAAPAPMKRTIEDELCIQTSAGSADSVSMDWVIYATAVDFFKGRGRSELAERVWVFIDDPTSGAYSKWFAQAWVLIVGLSVLFTMIQTVEPPVFNDTIGACFETTFDVFFLLELLVRYSVRANAWGFLASPFNLVNVAAIIPLVLRAMFGFVIPRQEPALEWFFFCCVPVLRLLTLLRRLQLFGLFLRVLTSTLEALRFLLFLMLVVVLVFSSCLYLVEPRSNIGSLPTAMWFTIVTMTTVGYGDFTPESAAGHGIVSVLIVGSVLYMAMPIGVLGNAFTQVWSKRDQIQLASRTSARLVEWGYAVSDLPKLFRHFDQGSTGELTLQEFRELLEFLHVGMKDDRVVALFDDLDKDGGGTISCMEFMRVLFPEAYHDVRQHSTRKGMPEAPKGAPWPKLPLRVPS